MRSAYSSFSHIVLGVLGTRSGEMKIGVVGGGVVGRATARIYVEHVDEVRVWDVVKERSTHTYLDGLTTSDLIFVCLPTPQKPDSLECDVAHLECFFGQLPFGALDLNYALRSTVPIGTTKRLSQTYKLPNLVHSPEFLTARCAVTDSHLPSRNLVGYVGSEVDQCPQLLRDVYRNRFPGVPIHNMTSDESEAVKLFTNGFFATKIAYFNEVRYLSDKLGLDWGRVMGGILSDGRIAHSHTQVPGPDGKFGFGGSCLPKDLASLVEQIAKNGVYNDAVVTNAVQIRNSEDRKRGAE